MRFRVIWIGLLSLSLGACAVCDPNRRAKMGAVIGTGAGAASGAIIGGGATLSLALVEGAAGAWLGHRADRAVPPGSCVEPSEDIQVVEVSAEEEQAPVPAEGVILAPLSEEEAAAQLARMRELASLGAASAEAETVPVPVVSPELPETPIEETIPAPEQAVDAEQLLPEVAEFQLGRPYPVGFGQGSSALPPGGRAFLQRLVALAAAHPTAKVLLIGHASSEGDPGYNERLSRRRAESVAKEMESLGIVRERIEIRARGARDPISDNSTEVGRVTNRRVEVIVEPDAAG